MSAYCPTDEKCEIQAHPCTRNTAGFNVVARIWQKSAKRLKRCVGSAIEIKLVIELVIAWDQDGISLRPPNTTALRIVGILRQERV